MCLETSTTYGCGHWNTVVAPCRVRGTARCQLHKLPPRINTWYCSPACPGVSIWVPPPGFGWVPTMPNLQQTHGRTPAFPGFPQPLPDVPTRNVTELNASSRFEQACNMSAAEMQLYYTATHGMLIQDAQAPYTPFPNASNTFTSMYPSTASYGPTTQCLTTRWQPFEPPTYRPMFSQTGLASAHGVPSKVSAANKEAESAYKSSVPVAQMYEKGQKTLSECMMEKCKFIIDLKVSSPVSDLPRPLYFLLLHNTESSLTRPPSLLNSPTFCQSLPGSQGIPQWSGVCD